MEGSSGRLGGRQGEKVGLVSIEVVCSGGVGGPATKKVAGRAGGGR